MPGVRRPPVGSGQRRCQQNGHQKRPRNAVCQLRQPGLLQRRAFHQCHDLRKAGLPTRAFHQHLDRRLQVVAARCHAAAHGARHGRGFARQQSLVGMGVACRDASVGRKRLPWQHADGVPHPNAPRGYAGEAAIRRAPLHAVGQAVHHGLQGARRAVAQAQLQPAAGEQKENKHGQGVVVHLLAKDACRVKSAGRADHERDGHAQRHGQVHADAAQANVTQRAGKKGTAGKHHHGQRDDPGGPAQQLLHLARQVARLRHVGGPRVHHHLHHAKARHQPAPQRAAALAQALVARKRIHGGHGAVTRVAHGFHPLRRLHLARLPHHAGPTRGGAHIGLQHARHGSQGVFDREGTGRAVHTLQHHMGVPRGGCGVGRGRVGGAPWQGAACRGAGSAKRQPFLGVIQQLYPLRRQRICHAVRRMHRRESRRTGSKHGHGSSLSVGHDNYIDLDQAPEHDSS